MADQPDQARMPGGIRRKIFASARLSVLQFASQIGLRLISTIVLTRLLAPEIYGVFAVVLVYRYLLEMFSDLGIRSVILTKEGETDPVFLRTCWTISVMRGGLIVLISGLIGLVIALLQSRGMFAPDGAYAAPVLPLAIAVLGGVSLVGGMQSTNRYAYERDMAFGRVTLGTVLANVCGLIVTILLAYHLRSIWALVIGAYVQVAVLTGFSFLAFKGPAMGVVLDRAASGIVINRGKWIIGQSSLTAMSRAADRLVLGFVMTSSTFGFYFIARQIVDLMYVFLTAVQTQMGLQVFTHILETDPAGFRKKYYTYRLFFDALSGLGAGGLYVLAQLAVDLIFDDRYGAVAPIIQLLLFGMLLFGPLILRDAYISERKFREMTLLSLVSSITLWAGLIVAVFIDNITAALLVIALHRLPEVIILWWLGARRQWVLPLREALIAVFFAIGAVLGWVVLRLWEFL